MFKTGILIIAKILLKIKDRASLFLKCFENKIIICSIKNVIKYLTNKKNGLRFPKKLILQSIAFAIVFSTIFTVIFQIAPMTIFSSKKAPFVPPLNGDIITKFRESYWDEENKVERKHTGIDISGQNGDKVIASGNGVVSYIGISPIGGRTVVIKHNEKIRTTYLNFLQIFVPLGTQINQGDAIGIIGAYDDPSSEIPHLHFGIIYDDRYLDPEDVLNIDYTSISKFIYLKYLKPDFSIKLN